MIRRDDDGTPYIRTGDLSHLDWLQRFMLEIDIWAVLELAYQSFVETQRAAASPDPMTREEFMAGICRYELGRDDLIDTINRHAAPSATRRH